MSPHLLVSMQPVTIKIVNGPRRGTTLENLVPPITIGREEGNDIQLNDDRMSRCHAKIQRDNERHVLIDLDSTNGTKVNGKPCQLHVLRYGDVITIGRSTLWFGTGRQIAERLRNLATRQQRLSPPSSSSSSSARGDGSCGSSAISASLGSVEPISSMQALSVDQLDPLGSAVALADLPALPNGLTPGQKAELAEAVDFFHCQLQRLIDSAEIDEQNDEVRLKSSPWQRLIVCQHRVAKLTGAVDRLGS